MRLKTLLILPLLVASLQAATVADLTFTLNGDGTEYSVTGCVQSASGSLDIPSTYIGLPVTSIGIYAFNYCSSLESITIPDSVTTIETAAFISCTSLGSITIPDSVTSIGVSAFQDCSGLTSITIPDSVTSIGVSAFQYCTNLSSITIPNSVTSIGDSAFYGCSGLTSITIPNSVTSIGSATFQDCTNLSSITIPNSVTSIGYGAFSGCSSLTSITIPNSVISIGESAFSETGLTFLEDTNSIKYLVGASGNSAYLIDGSSSTGSVILPNTLLGVSVASIGSGAFRDCTNLTSITIPEGVTSIGEDAFAFCTSLTSITIPSSVTHIGPQAFYDCSSLTSITIPSSVTFIGYEAFLGCTNLTSITIPAIFAPQFFYLGIEGNLLNNLFYQSIAEVLQEDADFVAKLAEAMIAAENSSGLATKEDLPIAVQQGVSQVIAAPSVYNLATTAEVAQARTEGRQDIIDNSSDYNLYSESSIMEMNVSNPTLSMLNESEQAQVEFTLETSTDLEDWNIEERIQRTVQATGDKFFVRIKSGAPYVTPTVLVFNHPSYGEILTDQSGNVLYGLSFDSVGGDPIYSGAAWPLAPQIADPEPDAGVTAALTSGTFSNTSGGPWLKVNNRPVYTYASDSEPNQATGQNSGTVWFTIKPDGTLNQ